MQTVLKASLILAPAATTLMLAPGLSASKPKPSPVAGKWAGKTKEDADVYQTKIQIKRKPVKGRRGGSVNYPSFPCGGKLIFLSRKKNRCFFRETLTYGLDNCYDGGLVRLSKSGRKVSFWWSDEYPESPGFVVGKLGPRN